MPPETDTFAPPKRDVSRTLRLRDSVWVRQAMDDLVAAEFALRLELEESQQDEEESFVDFARLGSSLIADWSSSSLVLGNQDSR